VSRYSYATSFPEEADVTYTEAARNCQRMINILNSSKFGVPTWLALLEDAFLAALPADSKLLAEFLDAKQKISKVAEETQAVSVADFRSQVEPFVRATCEQVLQNSYPVEDLKDQVERIIQKGYFQSPYFKALVATFGFLLALIVGFESWQLNKLAAEMRHLVDEAREQVQKGKEDIDKAESLNQQQQAKLALMLLQGDQDLVKMRTQAIDQIEKEGFAQAGLVRDRGKYWTDQLDTATGPAAAKQVSTAGENGKRTIDNKTSQATEEFDKTINNEKTLLNQKFYTSVRNLEATKSPWVPLAIWSAGKVWLFVPVALIACVLMFLNTLVLVAVTSGEKLEGRVFSWINTVLLIAFVVLSILAYMRA
jgi:hypothetical protein